MSKRWITPARARSGLAVTALSGLILTADDALAGPAAGTYDYHVHHTIHGLIGRHRMTVTPETDTVRVEHRLRIAVKYLFTVMYRREAVYRETWRDGRLVAFESRIDDAGDVTEVRAAAEAGQLLIQTPEATLAAPDDTVPAQPSLEEAAHGPWFMKVETGEVVRGKVEPPVAERVRVSGRLMPATHYRIGGLGHDVWYDGAGVFLKMQLERGGGTVTIVRDPAGG